MIDGVLTLFKTFIDIILLRKGPEDIPRSSVLLVFVVSFWLAAGAAVIATIDVLGQTDFVVSLMTSAVAILLYSSVLVFSNKSARLLQTLTAILGCGAVLQVFFVGGHVILGSLIDKNVAALISYLILLWSVPVEGHIIARATNRYWYVGFLIAFSVFLLQIELSNFINPVERLTP
jgi:hypothetical protein